MSWAVKEKIVNKARTEINIVFLMVNLMSGEIGLSIDGFINMQPGADSFSLGCIYKNIRFFKVHTL
jgi:hypothetical protein